MSPLPGVTPRSLEALGVRRTMAPVTVTREKQLQVSHFRNSATVGVFICV